MEILEANDAARMFGRGEDRIMARCPVCERRPPTVVIVRYVQPGCGAMSFISELDGLGLRELIACFHEPSADFADEVYLWCSEVAIKIRQQGEPGIAFLLDSVNFDDEERLRAILLGLTLPRLDRPSVLDLLATCLRDPRPTVVADAIDGLRAQQETGAREHVLVLRHHLDPWVRGAVLRYMSGLFEREAVPMLLAALHDPHWVVRANAVDELDNLDIRAAAPHIRPLRHDPHRHVREAAETAIEHFDADDAPHVCESGLGPTM